jgi:hypothetical protein
MTNVSPLICLECGATCSDHYPSCLHMFERTIVELSNQPHWRGELRMAMDAYALQHLEQFCPHRRSVAVHLMGLCWGLEWNGDPKVAKAMQRWLERQHDLPEIPPPFISPFQEMMSVSDVILPFDPDSPEPFVQSIRVWSQSVWQIWQEQHHQVRKWIQTAVSQAG